MGLSATELRIGNYHYYHIVDPLDERGEYDDVCQIDPDDFRILTQFDCPEYKPIPLTEEWLLKFGFELLTDKKKGYKNTSYSHGKIPILLYWDGSRLSTTFWQGNEMRFVHQLQNLIFALTGNELTIKINKP